MKIPFSFGSKFFFRFLAPGVLVAVGLLPILLYLSRALGLNPAPLTLLTVSAVVFGWIVGVNDQFIYMIFQGRRLWPKPLREWRMDVQQKKLDAWLSRAKNDLDAAILAYRYQLSNGKYPPNSGDPSVKYPTELANVIAGYETYPTTKYGVDGAFFWHRIWLNLPKDMRDEIDEYMSFMDSAVYASFACACNALLFFVYGVLDYFFYFDELFSLKNRFDNFIVSVIFLVAAWVFYRASIAAAASFGERSKAMFDCNLDKLSIRPALDVIGKISNRRYNSDAFEPEDVKAAWRYLRWHRWKETPESDSEDIEEVRRRNR